MRAELIEIRMVELGKSWADPIGGVVGVKMEGEKKRFVRDGGLKR